MRGPRDMQGSGHRCAAYAIIASLFLIAFFALVILAAIRPLQGNPVFFSFFFTLMIVLLLSFIAIFLALGEVICDGGGGCRIAE